MIKLKDFAHVLQPEQRVILEDLKTQRISFEGVADDLLVYSGIDYKKVADVMAKGDVLIIKIRNGSY